MRSFRNWVLGYGIILSLTMFMTHWGSKAVTVMAETAPARRHHTIIVDPGHGGVDGGATSCTGILESQFNLEIGLRLNDFFRFLGYDTKIVRTEDISVYTEGKTIARKKLSDLKQRVKLVNETENGILLSIHQNNFPDGRYFGAQVFYPKTQGSQEMAQKLQSAFSNYLESARKEKPCSSVYLMEHIRKPGLLIECGFLSNPGEEAKLRTPDYQKKLSAVIACTMAEILSNT